MRERIQRWIPRAIVGLIALQFGLCLIRQAIRAASPLELIAIGALVKKPGDDMTGDPIELLAAKNSDPAELLAYEELLDDAMHGDSIRFASEAYVEEAWRIVQPVLGNATAIHFYSPGTWGPLEAEALAPAEGGWRNPS